MNKTFEDVNETDLQVIGGAVKDHVTSVVVGGNVVLGQTRFAAVKGSLVSDSIGTVAKGGSDVHNWAENRRKLNNLMRQEKFEK